MISSSELPASADSATPLATLRDPSSTAPIAFSLSQVLDLVRLFTPITKYSAQVREPEIVPEVVRKAFKVAEAERPGCSFIELPENVAGAEVAALEPLRAQAATPPTPPIVKVEQAAEIISEARYPIVLAGNGVFRAGASEKLLAFVERLNVPVATTFMAKGAIPFSHPLSLGTVGLQSHTRE